MKDREAVIKDCFQSWITEDRAKFEASFSPEVHYIESWGPAYRNLKEVLAWFDDWIQSANQVIAWDIRSFWHEGNVCICEWYFQCENKETGEQDGFDGVSIIHFDENNKIVYLKEYQSKLPNHYPYEK